jgi:hypothetical protein
MNSNAAAVAVNNINYVRIENNTALKRQKIFHQYAYEVVYIPMELCDSENEEDAVNILEEDDPLEPRQLFPEDEVVPVLILLPPPPLRAQYTSWVGENGQIVYNSPYGNRYYDEDPIENDDGDLFADEEDNIQIIT